MTRSIFFVASLLALIAGNALAQSFPAKPLTLICPCPRAPTIERHLQAFAQIASKYVGQPVLAEIPAGANSMLGLATMAASARPDGYTLSILPIGALRMPHMQRVPWDPLKDFTYIIGLAGASFGVVVKSDSQFKTLKDLIDFAKANPGKFPYGAPSRGGSGHLVMEELADKVGARFAHVPIGTIADSARSGPNQHEINGLVALFSANRHAEMEAVARQMIQTWPDHGMG